MYVVDGSVPFIIAKPTLISLRAIEAHCENYVEIAIDSGERVRLGTYIGSDGHTRIPLRREHMQMNVSESILNSMITSLPNNGNPFTLSEGKQLIDEIHSRTHIYPSSLKLLLQ